MKIQTREGIAEGAPLSDIQEYNKLLSETVAELRKYGERMIEHNERLRTQGKIMKIGIVVGVAAFIAIYGYLLWFTWYGISNDVLGNILKQLGG